jgi:serine protease
MKAAGVAGAAASTSGIVQATPSGRAPGPKEDELLVTIPMGHDFDAVAQKIEAATPGNASVVHRNRKLSYLSVKNRAVQAASTESSLADRLRGLDEVKSVDKNETHDKPQEVNDPKGDAQYAPQLVNAFDAYDVTMGSEDVTVAVVDQGVMYDHPDLEAQFGASEGKDFVDDDADPYPDSMSNEYHGTHVAGIASATTGNSLGIAGISNSRIISGRALSEEGSGSTSDIADAVQWAADQGADIVNMSLGGGGYTDVMKNAVSYALNNGALPICAAGNDGSSSVSYPAAYDECVAVSAVDENENLASFSQYGDKLDVAAPGVDILSTWTEYKSTYGGKYNKISGTSMACPAASGVAALGKAANPDLSATQLRQALKDTAVDIGLSSQKQGAGRVDAANIVNAGGGGGGGGGGETEPPNADIATNTTTPDPGQTVTFDGAGSSDPDGGAIQSYQWEASTGGSATGVEVEGTWDTEGDVTVTLTVTDDEGETGSSSVVVSVGGGGETNEGPTADLVASGSSTTVGSAIEFDASGSSDPDGSIAAYSWDFGDGSSASGATTSHSWSSAGDYTVTLTVTDDDGATDTAQAAISVTEDSGGTCGDASSGGTADGYLYGWYDSDSYSYEMDLSDPCQATVSLDGPYRADLDLYVTLDGREPSPRDYDKRSAGPDSQEAVVLEDLEPGQTVGITVDSYSGGGSYTLNVEELGK